MKTSRIIKIAVDILMLALLIFLANRRNGMGLLLHAVLGIAEFVLFALHHLLNVQWYKILFKGKWNSKRIFLSLTDTVLMAAMILMMISSFEISGLIFEWDFFPVRFVWKNIHSVCSSTLFMITSFHLALHIRCRKGLLIYLIFLGAGVFAFTQSRIFSYWFLLYTDASLRWSDFMQIVFSVMIILGVISGVTLVRNLKQQMIFILSSLQA